RRSSDLLKGSPMRSFTAEQVNLGFIGMGAMGSRLAGRLRDYGYAVAVYDRNPAKAEALLGDEIAVFPRLAELAANSDVIPLVNANAVCAGKRSIWNRPVGDEHRLTANVARAVRIGKRARSAHDGY